MITPTIAVIGTSAGGVDALLTLFKQLPKNFSLPLVITQHIPAHANIDPNSVFGTSFSGRILEARDKMPIQKGHAYFAPPDYHLLIEKDFSLSLSQDELVHFSRPSIDVLFESAAASLGSSVCGVLLTGANEDGAAGLQAIQSVEGYTIVQNPDTAAWPIMPQSALQIFSPDAVLNLDEISQKLIFFSERGLE